MGNINFTVFRDSDIRKSTHELISESSKLKAEIFKTIVMGKELDKQNIKSFESYINEFLKFWSSYGDNLKAVIKDIKIDDCDEGIEVIEYTYIKNFIYGNYDYASILHFVDGILKGVNDKSMKTPADIDDFKNHTIDLAFNHQDPSVAGLLDSVLSEEIKSVKKKADSLDLKMFDTIRNYNDLFGFRDRPELYKAITKTLEYITTHNIAPSGYDHTNVRLFISLVNNIVEYITYSLTAYAVRIFVISQYANSFISCKHVEDSEMVTESVDLNKTLSLKDISENPNGSICSVFHNTDEMIIKDPKQYNEVICRLNEFLTLIGTEPLLKDSPKPYNFNVDNKWKNDNKLYKELKDNLLYDFFVNNQWFPYNRDRELNQVETNQTLKSIMYNKYQALEGYVTPKNQFMNIIQKIEYGSTVKDYQKLARDISTVAVDLIDRIAQTLNDKSWQLEDEMTGNYWKPGTRKAVAEIIKFLIDLYEELIFAFIQKIGYIEMKINELRSSEVKKVIDITSLNISGLKSDICMDNSMMLSVPDTTRAVVEQVDLYTLPIVEAYEMYDDYLRSLPEFANDWYLKEIADEQVSQNTTAMKDKIVDVAGSTISSIINKVRAILQSLWQRIQYFWNSQSFVLAKKWVIDNEETLKSLQFPADAKLEILPYKDEVTLPQGFSNLQKNLMNFNEKTVESSDSLQKYLQTLYPNNQVAQWFANDPEGKVAAQKYMNLILFDEGSDQPKKPIVITGADIAKKMALWINTIKESDATKDGFKKINDDINNAIGSINSKIVNINNQNKQAPDAASTDASQAAKADNQKDIKVNPGSDKIALVSDASNRITVAITRLWSPLAPMIIRAMMNQYGYIKAAYALGQATHQTHTPEAGAAQQKGQL